MQWLLYLLLTYLAACYLWGMYLVLRLALCKRPSCVIRKAIAKLRPGLPHASSPHTRMPAQRPARTPAAIHHTGVHIHASGGGASHQAA